MPSGRAWGWGKHGTSSHHPSGGQLRPPPGLIKGDLGSWSPDAPLSPSSLFFSEAGACSPPWNAQGAHEEATAHRARPSWIWGVGGVSAKATSEEEMLQAGSRRPIAKLGDLGPVANLSFLEEC